jgi:hypothetical protein
MNNKAHNVTRYDAMIMVVHLGQVLALAFQDHLWLLAAARAPRAAMSLPHRRAA